MTLRAFLNLVELPTKAASVLPFLLGTFYGSRLAGRGDALNFWVMLVSLLAIDMATTLLNNWMDYRRARVREGYNFSRHNALAAYNLNEREVAWVFGILVTVAALTGFYLVSRTDYWILVLGVGCFVAGMAYSWGPLPISHTPFGELVSGFVMGLVIPILASLVQITPGHFFVLRADSEWLALHLRWVDLLPLLLASWPLAVSIANVMLANNICDLEEDRQNGRRTLPVLTGKEPARWMYLGNVPLAFAGQALGLIGGFFKPQAAWLFLALPFVAALSWKFFQRPDKATTFRFSVYNLFLLGVAQIVILLLGWVV